MANARSGNITFTLDALESAGGDVYAVHETIDRLTGVDFAVIRSERNPKCAY